MQTKTTSQAGERTQELPIIIEDRLIPHRASEQGDRIGRVQTILFNGVKSTVNFWYSQTGQLLRVI